MHVLPELTRALLPSSSVSVVTPVAFTYIYMLMPVAELQRNKYGKATKTVSSVSKCGNITMHLGGCLVF